MTSKEMTATHVENEATREHHFIDLRAPGLLARFPKIGISLFIFGCLVFGAFTFNLYDHGPLLPLDNQLAHELPAIGQSDPALYRPLMDAGFYLGEQILVGFVILLLIYFSYKRYWEEFFMLLGGQLSSSILFFALSNFINRARPPTQIFVKLTVPGFPSGHAIGVIVFYGLVAYLLAPHMPSRFWKAFVLVVAVLIMLYVGFSRVFTGGHFLTDVLAGYGVGLAWSGLFYSFVELYYQRRRQIHGRKS